MNRRSVVPRLLRSIKKYCIVDEKKRHWCPVKKVMELMPERPWADIEEYWCVWYNENEDPEIGNTMIIGKSKYMIDECIIMEANRKNQKLPTKALVNFRRINT